MIKLIKKFDKKGYLWTHSDRLHLLLSIVTKAEEILDRSHPNGEVLTQDFLVTLKEKPLFNEYVEVITICFKFWVIFFNSLNTGFTEVKGFQDSIGVKKIIFRGIGFHLKDWIRDQKCEWNISYEINFWILFQMKSKCFQWFRALFGCKESLVSHKNQNQSQNRFKKNKSCFDTHSERDSFCAVVSKVPQLVSTRFTEILPSKYKIIIKTIYLNKNVNNYID